MIRRDPAAEGRETEWPPAAAAEGRETEWPPAAAAEGRETEWPPAAAAEGRETGWPPPPLADITYGDDPHDPMPPAEYSFALPEPQPDGLAEDAGPAFEGGLATLVYRMQAQLELLAKKFSDFCGTSSADRRDMRRLLERHTSAEEPRLRAIQTRLNVCTALVLAVGLFALAGPEGLRQIGEVVSRGGTLGFDGMVTLAGAAIPILYPIGRRLFLRLEFRPLRRKDDVNG